MIAVPEGFQFAYPHWFWVLLVLPLIAWLRGRRPSVAMAVPFAGFWHRPTILPTRQLPLIFFYAGLAAVIFALARPQVLNDRREIKREGYDLMLAIDLSGSMLAEDYERGNQRINRLEAIRPVISSFIRDREGDRIGLVVFSGRAYTMSPLTFDHAWLEKQVDRLKVGLLEDGTAIGDGLAVALSRLEQKQHTEGERRKGAFVVLLTDGASNRGILPPLDAATIAQSRGVPVYTIGAGREGIVPMPVFDDEGRKVGYQRVRSDLDEDTLIKIANMTSGQYFRAHDNRTVEAAFSAIDTAQKIEFQASVTVEAEELYPWPCTFGVALILLGAWLGLDRRHGTGASAPAGSVRRAV